MSAGWAMSPSMNDLVLASQCVSQDYLLRGSLPLWKMQCFQGNQSYSSAHIAATYSYISGEECIRLRCRSNNKPHPVLWFIVEKTINHYCSLRNNVRQIVRNSGLGVDLVICIHHVSKAAGQVSPKSMINLC